MKNRWLLCLPLAAMALVAGGAVAWRAAHRAETPPNSAALAAKLPPGLHVVIVSRIACYVADRDAAPEECYPIAAGADAPGIVYCQRACGAPQGWAISGDADVAGMVRAAMRR